MLKKLHPKWISGYHEHDSLLEHRFAEELTEEEQKKAWENYEAKKTETVDYVARATLMSQLHQQQNNMLAMSESLNNPTTSTNGNNQSMPMPYRNQPQPPTGTTAQGIDEVIQLAFQRCQQLPALCRKIKAIDGELNKKGANDALREMRKKTIEDFGRCCKFLQGSVMIISTAIKQYAAFPSYQASLAAAKQFILDSVHNASSVKL